MLSFAAENDSFMSDDDALSEPQLLAMLAEIECKYLSFEEMKTRVTEQP